tara:strand:- start:476 stop:778 length:303 start_codon:yes stop_codon:yes gene_type:complete
MTNEEKVATATPSTKNGTYDKPFELGDNKIMIFKNHRKEDAKQPDYWGKAITDGVEKRIGLWINEGANGKYFAGNISDYVPNVNTSAVETSEEPKSDLPF